MSERSRAGRGGRTVAVVGVTAALALGAGLLAGRAVTSPAEAAAQAEPPAAGPITVPVERRVLSDDVVLRGDVRYDDPAPVTVETGDRGEAGPAVVTGAVPEVGATLEAGAVLLEVTGRPVLVLPGELPVYRSLRVGSSGPDVVQLEEALTGVGIDVGEVGDTYDSGTAVGVRALFERAGYAPPSAGEEVDALVEDAEAALEQAEADLEAARAALQQARSGPSESTRVEADNGVREAERQLAAAREGGDAMAVAAAADALELARAQRREALAVPAPVAEQQALTAAERAREGAREALAAAREEALTGLPASEVVFLPSLPRRVDEVSVRRGGLVEGAVVQVSGATLEVSASASTSDAALLEPGMPAVLAGPDGEEVPVEVASVAAEGAGAEGEGAGASSGAEEDGGEGADGGSSGEGEPRAARSTVVFAVGTLTDEQLTALQGQNVRVTVPVSSTGGEVLAVPLAALTAGPGGESRVEVAGDDGATELVVVETGLAADGYAEVSGPGLDEGDLVVVGR